MEKNASLPFGSFNSLALFTGLCLGASPAAGIAAENSVKNSEETLVVEAAPPSLYSPGASADPKFNKPLVDTTRTITVIPEQVIKDQGVTNLTDALKIFYYRQRYPALRTRSDGEYHRAQYHPLVASETGVSFDRGDGRREQYHRPRYQ